MLSWNKSVKNYLGNNGYWTSRKLIILASICIFSILVVALSIYYGIEKETKGYSKY